MTEMMATLESRQLFTGQCLAFRIATRTRSPLEPWIGRGPIAIPGGGPTVRGGAHMTLL